MSDGRRLVNAMREAGKTPENEVVDLVVGKVTSIAPLKIKVDKIELTASFLTLGALCKAATIKVPSAAAGPHNHKILEHETQPAGSDNHKHRIAELVTEKALPEITLWRGLIVGDEVYMIKCSRGQKYFVLQRKDGIL